MFDAVTELVNARAGNERSVIVSPCPAARSHINEFGETRFAYDIVVKHTRAKSPYRCQNGRQDISTNWVHQISDDVVF
jgi:hypothetical protein